MSAISLEFPLLCAGVLAVYYLVPGRWQWRVLLAAGGLFYWSQGPENLGYMLVTILTTYAASLYLSACHAKYDKAAAKKRGRPWLAICLGVNFGMLFAWKVNLLRGGLLPLGISFYLFQTMGYLVDVYRGRVAAERNLGKLALFVSYFPQLIQGPISRFSQLALQLTSPHPFDGKQVSFGLQRMLWGYFKLLVIGQRLAPAVAALRMEAGGAAFRLLSVLYAIRLYGDFTGGIDLVLGLSQALGIRLTENFRRPFFSESVAEFWQRWHISLGTWMKDYVFYPLSVSCPIRALSRWTRKRWSRLGKRLPVYAVSIVTWFVTGSWHGLTPNFILWGMMNCAVIVISQELEPLYGAFHARFGLDRRRWYRGFRMLRTFVLMNFIRLADLYPDVEDYVSRLGALFAPGVVPRLGLSGLELGILGAGLTLMLAVSLIQERGYSLRQLLWQKHWLLRDSLLFALFLAVLLLGCYGMGYDAGNFIYSQF